MFAHLICRLLGKHKVDPANLTGDVRCLRCDSLLSQDLSGPPSPTVNGPIWDRSFTNGCLGKVRFGSFQQAENRLARMRVRPATLHAYHCTHCKGFHLGNHR